MTRVAKVEKSLVTQNATSFDSLDLFLSFQVQNSNIAYLSPRGIYRGDENSSWLITLKAHCLRTSHFNFHAGLNKIVVNPG